MESDRDVLGRADALLKRQGIAPDPADVPVLTDLVETPAVVAAEAAHPELAQEILRKVLAEVEGRFARDLESRLMQYLEPQLRAAVASALDDLRQELANVVGDAVAEAVRRPPVK
jgi:hypothetical protein